MKAKKGVKKKLKVSAKTSKRRRLKTGRKPTRKPIKTIKLQRSFVVETPKPAQTVAPSMPQNSGFQLPQGYGDNRQILMVRDPWWIFSYWEVTAERAQQVLDRLRGEGGADEKTVLRVYDVTDTELSRPNANFDIEVAGANNWYIDVGLPNRQWQAQIGFKASDGRFFELVTSNLVRTPRYGASEVLDEDWLLPDDLYWKLFGASSGMGRSASSLEARQILDRYLKSIVSSKDSPGAQPKTTPHSKASA